MEGRVEDFLKPKIIDIGEFLADFGYGCGRIFGAGSASGASEFVLYIAPFGEDFGYGDNCKSGCGDCTYEHLACRGKSILQYLDRKVYEIDGNLVFFTEIEPIMSEGAIIREDMLVDFCYICKNGNSFGIGKTTKEAYIAACKAERERKERKKKYKRFK